MTAKYKVIILLIALLGGGCLGSAYSFIAANDLNKAARAKLRPGADIKAKDEIRLRAAKRVEEMNRLAAEADAAKNRELAEKLAQSSPLRNLFGSGGSPATTATATVRESDGDSAADTRRRARQRATPKPQGESLSDVAQEGRKILQGMK